MSLERSKSPISIDIGCGPRNNLALYGHEVREPTVAIDSNWDFLRGRSNNGARGNLILADAQHLPIANGVADNVFLTHVLEHVNSAEEVLSEVQRITSPGAQLTIAVPDSKFESVMSKLDKDYHSPKMHQRVIKSKDIKRMLKTYGFDITMERSRGFMAAISITLMYLYHLKVKKDRQMQEQSGQLIPKGDTGVSTNATDETVLDSKRTFIQKTRRLLHLFSSHPLLKRVSVWNKIYPFENFVQATKSSI